MVVGLFSPENNSEGIKLEKSLDNYNPLEVQKKVLDVLSGESITTKVYNRANLFGLKNIRELFLENTVENIISNYQFLDPEFELKRDFLTETVIKKIGNFARYHFGVDKKMHPMDIENLFDSEDLQLFLISCQNQYGKIDRGFFTRIARFALRGDL